ncbi:MAG: tRNA 4-thiouridine(8) synthase ThiI [Acidobacteria bacterium]|nr:tRNA 4-thiouridine(8) synthase ThiI [Acidobacteriota bacterium]MDA1234555.1 tRNA 4-thiouridine(8) synthase ThiI [Acidobacteriota bacterium]
MTGARPLLVLHYSELWLKGCNKPFFISKLKTSIEQTLEGLPVRLEGHVNERMVVSAQTPEAAQEAAARLQRVPGIEFIGVGVGIPPTLERILAAGLESMRGKDFHSYRVRAKRASKQLPFRSLEVERQLGALIGEQARAEGRDVRVDLSNAEATCFVQATATEAVVFTDKLRGLGGLPTGTAGRLMCLLSGGIDSAVAAYKIMRRGVRVNFVHFYGAAARPGEESPPIAREVVRQLTPYQGLSRLFLVDFDPIQRHIVANAPDEFRLLLYRRFMLRISEKLARGHRCHGTITGDSIAQVASQTIANIEGVNSVAKMPVYRPLCGDDKQEITAIARKIGTYETSIEPFTDCCPLYMPRNPRLFASIDELDAVEAQLEADHMIRQATMSLLREVYEYRMGKVERKSVKQYVVAAKDISPVLAG